LIALVGESALSALGGLVIGALFGFFAQRSRFCLRAATIDFWRGSLTVKVAVWMLTFGTALLLTQWAIITDIIDTSSVRYLNARGSLSGALIGGAMFGAGMVMTRGCASRLLVLSANGNLRALLSGLIFAVAAQASFRGVLSPARETLAELWTVSSPTGLNMLSWMGGGHVAGIFFALVWLFGGASLAWRLGMRWPIWFSALMVGVLVMAGWAFTSQLAGASFTPQPVHSLSFSGPSANMLMMVLSSPELRIGFDIWLIPGVFLGSFLSAFFAGELKLEGFHDGATMRRYIAGAMLMGFGGMLAGGCAIGAGVSGASLFATTAWLTLLAMWLSAGLTDLLLDAPKETPGFAQARSGPAAGGAAEAVPPPTTAITP
ncbi:MAG: YeeE/YedE family protein, partial [Proteobacteria bacterium]|nr:YeeE/YedE family protein [Pseudomonadota bacterium]